MSTMDDINTAAANMAALSQQVQGIITSRAQFLADLTARFSAFQNGMEVRLYCDPIGGLDTNPGTQASPIKTLTRALALTPYLGVCRCYLMNNLLLDTPVDCTARRLILLSANTTKYVVEQISSVSGTYRDAKNFAVGNFGGVSFDGLTIKLADASAVAASAPNLAPGSAFVRGGYGGGTFAIGMVEFNNCSFDLPAVQWGPLCDISTILVLNLRVATMIGAATNLNGRVVSSVTNTAGTAANTIANVISNLATL